MEDSYNYWLRRSLRLHATALTLRVGLAFAAAHACEDPLIEALSAAASNGIIIS
jgi:hypothetical protein